MGSLKQYQQINYVDLYVNKCPEVDTIQQNMKRNFIFTSKCPQLSSGSGTSRCLCHGDDKWLHAASISGPVLYIQQQGFTV